MSAERGHSVEDRPRHLVNEVTGAALSLIREDGSVVIHDEDGEFVADPVAAIDVDGLPAAFKRRHLHFIASSIEGAILGGTSITRGDLPVEQLAHGLAPYREHHAFVWHAAALVVVNPEGYPVRVTAPSLAALDVAGAQ